jgi:hypothetical protein
MAESGLAAGAKAGAAFGPMGAAIGGVAGAASDALNAAMGGPFKGGDSSATYGASMFDNSGWTINIGSGSASTSNDQTKKQEQAAASDDFAKGLGYMPGMQQAGVSPVVLLAVAGVVVVLMMRKGRR